MANTKNLLKGGKIGHKGGGGRPADWLKEKCRSLVEKNGLIDFLADVATGKDIDQKINENGECLKVPADVKYRIQATEILVERGFGKVVQELDLGENAKFVVICDNAPIQREG